MTDLGHNRREFHVQTQGPCGSEHAPRRIPPPPNPRLPTRIMDGCQTASRPTSIVVPQLWESSPLKHPLLLRCCNSQTCRTFPVTVMFPSASRPQAHMVEASVTSAVNMTLFGHTEDSQALEIEPFFSPPPAEKEFLQPHRNCALTRPAAT